MTKKPAFLKRNPLAKFLLIRHGETNHNREGRFYGQTDTPLNKLGLQQAAALVGRLQAREIDQIYSSPLQRAQQTAHPLATSHQLTVQTDPLLIELDFGNWEGLLFEEARALDPDAWDAWQAGKIYAPYDGEPINSAIIRMQKWIDHVVANHTGQTVAAVAHGGILQTAICALLDIPVRSIWQFRFKNTTIAEIDLFEAGGVMLEFN